MSIPEFEIEPMFRVYCNSHGYFYQVRFDPDGGDLIELSYSEDGKKTDTHITLGKSAAKMVAQCLLKLVTSKDELISTDGGDA